MGSFYAPWGYYVLLPRWNKLQNLHQIMEFEKLDFDYFLAALSSLSSCLTRPNSGR